MVVFCQMFILTRVEIWALMKKVQSILLFLLFLSMKIMNIKNICEYLKKLGKNCLKEIKKNELKYNNSSQRIRELFLKELSKINLFLFSVSVNKSNVKQNLRENRPILYNYLLRILLEKVLPNVDKHSLNITIDRSFSKNIRIDMEVYVQTSLVEFFKQLPKVNILHESSQNNSGLQIVDFVVGAIHDNLKGNEKSVFIISKKLKVDKMLF